MLDNSLMGFHWEETSESLPLTSDDLLPIIGLESDTMLVKEEFDSDSSHEPTAPSRFGDVNNHWDSLLLDQDFINEFSFPNTHEEKPPNSLSLSSLTSERDSFTEEFALDEIEKMINSLTDPVGKFLRKNKISARSAIELNIHHLLLQAPRKIREKYGPRRSLNSSDRVLSNRERNREHARSTRQRKKIFKEINAILSNHFSKG